MDIIPQAFNVMLFALRSDIFWLAMFSALVFTVLLKITDRFMFNEHKEFKKELEQRKKELDKWEKELSRYFESNLSQNKEHLNIILNRLQTQTHNNQEQIKTVQYLKYRNDQLYRENQSYKARLDRCKKKIRKLEADK